MEWLFVAAAVVGGISKIKQGKMSADAMEAQARDAEEQARIAEIQAQIAIQQSSFAAEMQVKAGREEATYRRKDSRRAAGSAVAAVAASGLEVSGSPLALIGEHIRSDELYAGRVITNANLRAASEESRGRAGAAQGIATASAFRSREAALYKQAEITRKVSWLDAITGGMSAAGGYYAMTGGGAGSNPQPNYTGPSGYDGGWGDT